MIKNMITVAHCPISYHDVELHYFILILNTRKPIYIYTVCNVVAQFTLDTILIIFSFVSYLLSHVTIHHLTKEKYTKLYMYQG